MFRPQKNRENDGATSAYSKLNGAITRVRVKLVAEWEMGGGGGWVEEKRDPGVER